MTSRRFLIHGWAISARWMSGLISTLWLQPRHSGLSGALYLSGRFSWKCRRCHRMSGIEITFKPIFACGLSASPGFDWVNSTSVTAFEARVITHGQERWVRVFHHLKKDRSGRWLKGVGMIHDFDDRKRQELALVEAQRAAEAAAEAKAAFLANMSHEIRTPMNGVMGVLHLLKTEALSEEGRRMLEEALSCGQICAAMVQVARRSLRQTGATKNIFAIAVMLHLRAPYDSKTAILGCWVDCSGQKSKSRLNSKDLDRLVSS